MKKSKYYIRPDGLHETIREINGKRKAFRGHTDSEVDRKMIAYMGAVERGRTFKEVAEEWNAEHWETIKHGSQRGYNAAYKRILEWFGSENIKEIKPNDIKAFLEYLKREEYAQKSVMTHSSLLNMIFDYGISSEHRDIEINPCVGVKLPKGLKKEARQLPSDEDIEKIKAHISDSWAGLFLFFITQTGARRGEALAIRSEDIDGDTIKLHRSMTFKGSTPVITEPKTKAGIREVPVLDALKPLLPSLRPDQLIFFPDGKTVYKTTVDRQIKHFKAKYDIKATPHQFRHRYAQSLYEAGIDLKTAQGLLGHAQLSTTADIYTHFSKAKNTEAAEKLNAFAKSKELKKESCEL